MNLSSTQSNAGRTTRCSSSWTTANNQKRMNTSSDSTVRRNSTPSGCMRPSRTDRYRDASCTRLQAQGTSVMNRKQAEVVVL